MLNIKLNQGLCDFLAKGYRTNNSRIETSDIK